MFVSSTLRELAPERAAASVAIQGLHFIPVLFELGARPHPPRALYRAYLEQSDVFVGIYWERYGWVAPGMEVSGLEDEYLLAGSKPKLVYVKQADEREPGLRALLERISADDVSYRHFATAAELRELLADDLALLVSERFVPASPPATRARRLPAPASSFVGREAEVANVLELVRRRDVRLVTLTGAGGIGKTRLALEAARTVADEFADGAAFVPLAGVADAEGVPVALADTLGARAEGDTALPEAVATLLAPRELLLVLDNFEHVLAAAPLVGRLLAAAPRLRVLATSRSRLDLSGEHLFHVPPMTLPDAGEHDVQAIERTDAVRLFATRAAASGWTTTEADAPVLAAIVRRLDGLPLAIELAAAQARLVPAELVHTRLRRRLDLGGGPRDAEERHRTLRSTIAWSYDLLDEPARRFFQKVSIFVGGFSLDAAAAVIDSGEAVEELLATLVDASLLTIGPAPATGVRFGMLDTIREYAAERLDQAGSRSDAEALHLRYYVELADAAYEAAPFDAGTRLRLDEERENLRAAYWEARRDDPEQAVRLSGALGVFFARRGLTREGRDAIAQALDASPDARVAWRARALVQLAWLTAVADECDEADRLAFEALELYRGIGDKRGIGASLNTLGFSAGAREDAERAMRFYREAYEAFSETEPQALRLYAAVNLAAVLSARGELDEARRLYTESLEYFEPRGLHDEVATIQYRLAEVEETGGDPAAARALFDASTELARRVGNRVLLAWDLMRLGHVEAQLGHVAEARAALLESLELHLELGQSSGISYCLEYAARAAQREGRPEVAVRLLGAASERRAASGMPMSDYEQVRVDETKAELRSELGDERFEDELAAGGDLTPSELLELAGVA